jgi:hypothetical protein
VDEYQFEYQVDAEFRQRLEIVLEKILRECLDYKGEPIEQQKMLARFSIEAVGSIYFNDRFQMANIDILISLTTQLLKERRYTGIMSKQEYDYYTKFLFNRYIVTHKSF